MKFKNITEHNITMSSLEIEALLDYLSCVKPKNKEIPKIPFEFTMLLSDALK